MTEGLFQIKDERGQQTVTCGFGIGFPTTGERAFFSFSLDRELVGQRRKKLNDRKFDNGF